MVDTATPRNRLRNQSLASNVNLWGDPFLNTNNNLLDQSLDGVETITATSSTYTLSSVNYATDEARQRIITVTGTPGTDVTIVAPDNQKWYYLINELPNNVGFRMSTGNTVTVGAGRASVIYSDGSNYDAFVPTDFQGRQIGNVGAATVSNSAATLQNRLDQFAAPTSSVSFGNQLITNLASPTTSGEAATRGYVLTRPLSDFQPPTTNLSIGSQKLTLVASATVSTDATNLGQVETLIANVGGNPGSVRVTGADTTANFLANKMTGSGISYTVVTPGGNETLRADLSFDDLNSKSAAAEADLIALADSAASFEAAHLTIANLRKTLEQDIPIDLGTVTSSANVDVLAGNVYTLTGTASTEITLTNIPSGRGWEVALVIASASSIADLDGLITNSVNWVLADSSTDVLFSAIDGITIGAELRLLMRSFGSSIYGYVI